LNRPFVVTKPKTPGTKCCLSKNFLQNSLFGLEFSCSHSNFVAYVHHTKSFLCIFVPFQARPLLTGKKYRPLLDGKISNSCEEEKLVWLVQVTEQCLKKNPNDRYSMNVVSTSDVEYVNLND